MINKLNNFGFCKKMLYSPRDTLTRYVKQNGDEIRNAYANAPPDCYAIGVYAISDSWFRKPLIYFQPGASQEILESHFREKGISTYQIFSYENTKEEINDHKNILTLVGMIAITTIVFTVEYPLWLRQAAMYIVKL